MSTNVAGSLRGWLEEVPLVEGVAAGTAAFLGGYVAFVAVVWTLGGGSSGPLLGQATLLAVLFYNAHFVAMRTTDGLAPWVLDPETIDPLARAVAAGTTTVPPVVYYAIPAVAALLAGAVLAYRTHGEPAPVVETAARTGLATAPGYLLVGLAGVVAVTSPTTAGNVARPDLLGTLLFCTAYPFVLGTVGGLAGATLARSRAAERESAYA